MTEKEALETCTGFVNCDGMKGYFPWAAVRVLQELDKYEIVQSCCWGYVLRLVPPEIREARRREREARKNSGALEWLSR